MTDLLDAARRVVESTYKLCEEDEQDMRVPPDRKAVDDLEAALEAYEWSDEPPSEPGFYWYKDTAHAVHMSRIYPTTGNVRIFSGSGYTYKLTELEGQWAGPIPEPTDPE